MIPSKYIEIIYKPEGVIIRIDFKQANFDIRNHLFDILNLFYND